MAKVRKCQGHLFLCSAAKLSEYTLLEGDAGIDDSLEHSSGNRSWQWWRGAVCRIDCTLNYSLISRRDIHSFLACQLHEYQHGEGANILSNVALNLVASLTYPALNASNSSSCVSTSSIPALTWLSDSQHRVPFWRFKAGEPHGIVLFSDPTELGTSGSVDP